MTLTLHAMQRSANCYKVRLALAHLGQDFVLKDVDIRRGDTRTPEFLALNPRGRVPVLQLDDGTVLIESNAILLFLGEGTRFVPEDKIARARMMQWMFFEQNSHHPSIGEARFWMTLIPGGRELKRDLIDDWMEQAEGALARMQDQLTRHPFIAGDSFTLADIALYANTHLAAEADLNLQAFPAVFDWIGRIAAMPGHVDMDWRPAG
ncbi:glutathione S-transferase family protein [Phreatobacter stygius]|uniref:Glutathione S-transferase family protein n=1 Tax=Phreatobacter stygius TaxID=1940610 RepID=A0A4D7AWU6_9HYPH|nr:glutathione S-transferase family protein [Phreatobacter stygius]QCI63423.1 glutathione S-transferase family protein [Phreatobacter stygius]